MRRLFVHVAVGVAIAGATSAVIVSQLAPTGRTGVSGSEITGPVVVASDAPNVAGQAPVAVDADRAVAGVAAARAAYSAASRSSVRTSLSELETLRAASARGTWLAVEQRDIQLQGQAIGAADRARVARLGYEEGTTDPRSIAKQIMANRYGWGAEQFACYNNIIMRESMWVLTATNGASGAYGIPQALPGSKMASTGVDWRTNPATQITWGLNYVKDRYGTPCGAWGFKSSHGWY